MWPMRKCGALARCALRGQAFGSRPGNYVGQAEHQGNRLILGNRVLKSGLGYLVKPCPCPPHREMKEKGKIYLLHPN